MLSRRTPYYESRMRLLTRDVELLWISRYDYRARWRLPLHAHTDFHQLIVVVNGEAIALIGEERRTVRKGEILLLPPGLRHGLEIPPGNRIHTIDTKFRIHHAPLRRQCDDIGPLVISPDPRIAILLEAILAEAEKESSVTHDLCQILLTQVLLLLLEQKRAERPPQQVQLSGPPEEPPGVCRKISRYLRQNYARKIDQKSLSRALNYSYRHLQACWQERHGESPLQSLRRYRVEYAMQLIRYSDSELKQIAEQTGFSTVYHFNRVFKQFVGTSPARWRDQERFRIRRGFVMRRGFVNKIITEMPSER